MQEQEEERQRRNRNRPVASAGAAGARAPAPEISAPSPRLVSQGPQHGQQYIVPQHNCSVFVNNNVMWACCVCHTCICQIASVHTLTANLSNVHRKYRFCVNRGAFFRILALLNYTKILMFPLKRVKPDFCDH